MVKILFTDQARSELREIKSYISFQSPLQAMRVVEKIIDEIQRIPTNPSIGRSIIITSKFTVRQLLVFKYRIFYREINNQVEILSIFHSARLLDNNPGLQKYFEEE